MVYGREVRNAAHRTFLAQGYQEDSPDDDPDHYVWDDRFYQPDMVTSYSKPAKNSPDGLYHAFCIYDDGLWYHHAFYNNTKRRGYVGGWVLLCSGSGKDALLSHLNQNRSDNLVSL